jgi:hypothetical protein
MERHFHACQEQISVRDKSPGTSVSMVVEERVSIGARHPRRNASSRLGGSSGAVVTELVDALRSAD